MAGPVLSAGDKCISPCSYGANLRKENEYNYVFITGKFYEVEVQVMWEQGSPANLKCLVASMWRLYLMAFYRFTFKVTWTYIHDFKSLWHWKSVHPTAWAAWSRQSLSYSSGLPLDSASHLNPQAQDTTLFLRGTQRIDYKGYSWIKVSSHSQHLKQETRDARKGKKEKIKDKRKETVNWGFRNLKKEISTMHQKLMERNNLEETDLGECSLSNQAQSHLPV